MVEIGVAEDSLQNAILFENEIGIPSHAPDIRPTLPVDKSVHKMLKIRRKAHICDVLRP